MFSFLARAVRERDRKQVLSHYPRAQWVAGGWVGGNKSLSITAIESRARGVNLLLLSSRRDAVYTEKRRKSIKSTTRFGALKKKPFIAAAL